MNDVKERLLNTEEMAGRLGISPLTAKQWRYDGYGPPYKRLRGGLKGQVRYLESAVLEYMKKDQLASYPDELSKLPDETEIELEDVIQGVRKGQGRYSEGI
jgi:hypothetical protein